MTESAGVIGQHVMRCFTIIILVASGQSSERGVTAERQHANNVAERYYGGTIPVLSRL